MQARCPGAQRWQLWTHRHHHSQQTWISKYASHDLILEPLPFEGCLFLPSSQQKHTPLRPKPPLGPAPPLPPQTPGLARRSRRWCPGPHGVLLLQHSFAAQGPRGGAAAAAGEVDEVEEVGEMDSKPKDMSLVDAKKEKNHQGCWLASKVGERNQLMLFFLRTNVGR